MTDIHAAMAYGRRPPKKAPALMFASFADALVIPEHPPAFNSIEGYSGWDILGNDRIGDCVAVTWATIRRIVTTRDDGTGVYPGLDEVLAFYKTQNPTFDPNGGPDNGPGSPADGGMNIQTALEALVRDGGPDGVKALAFAKIDHTNIEEVRAALAMFGFLWIGVNVTDSNEREFPTAPWTLAGRVLGGHSVTGVGYDPSRFVMETWAHESYLSNDYVTLGATAGAGVEEAWVVIWPEHAVLLGADARASLDSAYFSLIGSHIAWPDQPAPEPEPEPVPIPTPEEEFRTAAEEWLSQRHTLPRNLRMADALRLYLAALDNHV